jgi:hypothetical protein
MLPFTTPTGYGLGKSGWVTATPADGEAPPIELFKAWIDESYRAQAPKGLVAQLGGAAPAKKKAVTKKKAVAKKAATKKKPAKKKAAKK